MRHHLAWLLLLLTCSPEATDRSAAEAADRSSADAADETTGRLDLQQARFEARSRRIHPRDHFPALDEPRALPAGRIRGPLLQPHDFVIGVRFGDLSRAYPLSILAGHEIINDTLAGSAIAVTW